MSISNNKIKVLLTGANGFLGRHVLKRLLDAGIDTVAVGRSLPLNCQPTNFICADLLNLNDFKNVVAQAEATHLLHLAWYAEHGLYWASPLNLRWVDASVRLVEAFCQSESSRHVIMAGTCAEYDWSYGYCSEDLTPLKPKTLYGISKDVTRSLTLAICEQFEVTHTWGRIFLPYGEGEDDRRLIPSLKAVFQGFKEPFGVNVSVYRDFLSVEDSATAFIKLLEVGAAGSFNICSGSPVMLGDVVKHFAKVYDADPAIVFELSSERHGEPHLLVGNNQKLKNLGWFNSNSFFDTLSR